MNLNNYTNRIVQSGDPDEEEDENTDSRGGAAGITEEDSAGGAAGIDESDSAGAAKG